MIALLDPALLAPYPSDDDARAQLDRAVRIVRHINARVPSELPYWRRMWDELGRGLERALNPLARRSLQALRRLGARAHLNPEAPADVRVWGFRDLFAERPDLPGAHWVETMTRDAVCALSAKDEVVLIVRLQEGRNLTTHRGKEHVYLFEVTRWALYLNVPKSPPARVWCYHHSRNADVRHTVRLDRHLPTCHEDARFPFCPPEAWQRHPTPAWRTFQAAPAWLDHWGNAWAAPNTPQQSTPGDLTPPQGEHWDLFTSEGKGPPRDRFRGVPVNIASTNSQTPGSLHHVPKDKAHRIDPQTSGWTCP